MTVLPAKSAARAALLLAALAPAGMAVLLCSAAPPALAVTAAEEFLAGFGDVPAMPGLKPAETEPLLFDKPTGRIAQTLLQGSVARKAVLSFYGQTLPQLGWKRLADTRFEREGEELQLEFPGAAPGGPTLVRFTLSPR